MAGIMKIILGEITKGKAKGKAYVSQIVEKLSPSAIANKKGNEKE